MTVANDEIAQIFEEMASFLEMKGDLIFKIRAYRRAAGTIRQLTSSLEEAVRQGQDLKKIPGIGDAISKKIQEFIATGQVAAHRRLRAEAGEPSSGQVR